MVVEHETVGFTSLLGLTFERIDGDEVVATWTVSDDHYQPYGIVHGGVYCSIVETLGSIGAAHWLGTRGKIVGVSNSTDFYRAVTEGTLRSVAKPLHRGRSQQVWLVETFDESERVVARGQLRLQNLTD